MATITFDTLDLNALLKNVGFSEPQSEAVVRAIAKAQDRLVTEEVLENRLAPIKADLLVLKWMMAVMIAVNVIPALTRLLAP